MEQKFYERLSETVYRHTLPNGLPVIVVPRPGFTKKLAYFVTDFGSIHTQFALDGVDYKVPEGIAHYLEHKMFDMPDGEVSEKFAAMGAMVNAFTGYDLTAYYFSCSDHFESCLELLLSFVSTPYFTESSVEKERGIIGQEIGMNADNPDNRNFEHLMIAMYRNHPVREPILGTEESIAQITPELLEKTHNAFYRPDNMLLCVIGDVDPEQVCAIAQRVLPPKSTQQVSSVRSWQEDMHCPESYVRNTMEVAMPMFQLGFKGEPLGRGAEAIRREIIGDLAAEALFGESSPLYLRMYEQGLIDSAFGGGLETIEGMMILTASGDSDQPEQVRDEIMKEALRISRDGIGEGDFMRMKRSALGRRIKDLDSFDSSCFRICAYYFSGYDYFDFPGLYQQIQVADLQEFLQRVVTPERCSLAVIYPSESEVNP